MTADVTFQVLPVDYTAALVADGARWEAPNSERRPTWSGRRVWTLVKGVTDVSKASDGSA